MQQDLQRRRALMTGLGTAAAVLAIGNRPARAQAGGGTFMPTHHQQDEWMDRLPGQHRVFIDSATPSGGGEALLFANNLFNANRDAYGLDANELAMVVCLRHFSTPFAYTDAMWKKYGQVFSNLIQFTDPNTKGAPMANLFNSAAYGTNLPNIGTTIDSLVERGTQFAVCALATQFFAGQVAQATGGTADDVYAELTGNAIPNTHFVAAGVIGVTRAQEYGYSLLVAG